MVLHNCVWLSNDPMATSLSLARSEKLHLPALISPEQKSQLPAGLAPRVLRSHLRSLQPCHWPLLTSPICRTREQTAPTSQSFRRQHRQPKQHLKKSWHIHNLFSLCSCHHQRHQPPQHPWYRPHHRIAPWLLLRQPLLWCSRQGLQQYLLKRHTCRCRPIT